MSQVDWDAYRDLDGYIDLVDAFLCQYPWVANSGPQEKFLNSVMELTPIRSRQAAAIALAMAFSLGDKDEK